MLGKALNSCIVLTILVVAFAVAAAAQDAAPTYDPSSNDSNDLAAGYKSIAKVKVPAPTATKVKPYSSGLASRFDALSRFNPVTWGPDCVLPVPAQGQFMVGPSFLFARMQGTARWGLGTAGSSASSVDFHDHLGLKDTGNVVWSLEAMYQFRPRWGLRYSFTPMTMEATHTPATSFNFGGNSFNSGGMIRSKWERYEHRAGVYFVLTHTPNAMTNVFADWLHVQDKLTVGGVGTATTSVTWESAANLAVVGLEFSKCLKNYRGNTLALGGKGGVAFLADTFGWEAELALSYLIPIKTGRFGFVKGGYRYTNMRTEKDGNLLDTTVDGPFVQLGFLF